MAVSFTPWGTNPQPVIPADQADPTDTQTEDDGGEDDSAETTLLTQALATIQQQASVIQSMLKQMARKP